MADINSQLESSHFCNSSSFEQSYCSYSLTLSACAEYRFHIIHLKGLCHLILTACKLKLK